MSNSDFGATVPQSKFESLPAIIMPGFQFTLDKRLRKTGLEGQLAWAMVHDGALQLQDEHKHVVRIIPSQIARLRIGYFDAKRRLYRTRLWLDTLDKPIQLSPSAPTCSGYRDTVNDLAKLMLDNGRINQIETGSSKFDALFGPILLAVPVIAAFGIALFVLTEEPWWGRLIVPLVPSIVLAVLVWVGAKRYWPKPVRELTDLKVQLPPV